VIFGRDENDENFESVLQLSRLSGSDHGFVIKGINEGGFSGTSVSNAGDINGDGIDDLIIGAPSVGFNNQPLAGESYIVFGKDKNEDTFGNTFDLSALIANSDPPFVDLEGFVIRGNTRDRSGSSVSNVGDINGDEIDDLIVTTPYANAIAEGYVIFGREKGKEEFEPILNLSSLSNPDHGFAIKDIHEDNHEFHIDSVSHAGDINADGKDDLIIGGQAFIDGQAEGRSYVIFGRDKNDKGFEDVFNLSSLSEPGNPYGFVIKGIDRYDSFGESVSNAGDFNDDGIDDLIIGAPEASYYTGESYVIFGRRKDEKKFESVYNISDSSNIGNPDLFIIRGINDEDHSYSGKSVSNVGDINDDGIDDVIISSWVSSGYAGESYIVFGQAWGSGNDVLSGGLGNDTITGGAGSDTFILVPTEDTDTITDFSLEDGDQIGLKGGLTYDQLAINQGSGDHANDPLIHIKATNEWLAILLNVNASDLTADHFIIADGNGGTPSPILDLTDKTGEVTLDFPITRNASYNNIVRFYVIDDATGTVDGIRPGDPDYTATALSKLVAGVELYGWNNQAVISRATLEGGQRYAPVLFQNGDLDTPFFAYKAANFDGAEHIRRGPDGLYYCEDLTGGGDNDFNDLVFKVDNVGAQGDLLLDLTGYGNDVRVGIDATLERHAAYENLVYFYATDAQGRVNGLMPGDLGYEDAIPDNFVKREDGSILALSVENGNSISVELSLLGGGYYGLALAIQGDTNNLVTLEDAFAEYRPGLSGRNNELFKFEDWIDNSFDDMVLTVNQLNPLPVV
jgi:hypothetical protein